MIARSLAVAIRPLRPDARAGMQVVILPDDARGMIIAEGYADPSGAPVLRREFELAKPRRQR